MQPLEVVDLHCGADACDQLALADRRVVIQPPGLVARAVIPGGDLAEREPADRLMAALHLAVLMRRVWRDRPGAEVQIGRRVLHDLREERQAVVVHHDARCAAVDVLAVGVVQDRVAERLEHGVGALTDRDHPSHDHPRVAVDEVRHPQLLGLAVTGQQHRHAELDVIGLPHRVTCRRFPANRSRLRLAARSAPPDERALVAAQLLTKRALQLTQPDRAVTVSQERAVDVRDTRPLAVIQIDRRIGQLPRPPRPRAYPAAREPVDVVRRDPRVGSDRADDRVITGTGGPTRADVVDDLPAMLGRELHATAPVPIARGRRSLPAGSSASMRRGNSSFLFRAVVVADRTLGGTRDASQSSAP